MCWTSTAWNIKVLQKICQRNMMNPVHIQGRPRDRNPPLRRQISSKKRRTALYYEFHSSSSLQLAWNTEVVHHWLCVECVHIPVAPSVITEVSISQMNLSPILCIATQLCSHPYSQRWLSFGTRKARIIQSTPEELNFWKNRPIGPHCTSLRSIEDSLSQVRQAQNSKFSAESARDICLPHCRI